MGLANSSSNAADLLRSGSTAEARNGEAGEEGEDGGDDRLYCVCQQLYDAERMMIACDRWVPSLFHFLSIPAI